MGEHMDVTMDTRRAHEYFLNELCYSIGPKGLKEKIKNDVNSFNLIDVRGYDDYIDGHIPFAMHVPYDELEEHFNMFSKEKVNIIYSYSIVCQLAKNTIILFHTIPSLCAKFVEILLFTCISNTYILLYDNLKKVQLQPHRKNLLN